MPASCDPSAPKPLVFVVLDMTDTSITTTLGGVCDAASSRRVVVPGLQVDMPQGRIFEDSVREHLAQAEKVIVLTDLPNANVGFELGYAIGMGKPTLLASVRRSLPNWIVSGGLFKGYFVADAGGFDDLVKLVERDVSQPGSHVALPNPESVGDATLFLCPSDKSGGTYSHALGRLKTNWTKPDLGELSFPNLPGLLSNVGRVVWTIAPVHGDDEPRDGSHNTLAAVIAGYAKANGRELVVLRDAGSKDRVVVDVQVGAKDFSTFEDYLGRLRDLIEPKKSGPVSPEDVLARYRRHLAKVHGDLIPFFGTSRTLEDVYVSLTLSRRPVKGEELERTREALESGKLEARVDGDQLTLRKLLERPRDEGDEGTPRWVVLGEPGSGKSTICRKLCHDLAREPDGPLPVLVNLNAWLRSGKNPFVHVEELLALSDTSGSCTGLAEALCEAARDPARVWVLFDGLDELDTAARAAFARSLPDLAGELGHAVLVVTSRPTGYERPAPAFREAELQPLPEASQGELLRRWIGPERGPEVQRLLEARPRLRELAPNPLMLTLVAQLHVDPDPDQPSLPTNRSSLYEQSVRLLLRHGHQVEGKGVKSVEAALTLLPELSLALQRTGKESWTFQELFEHVNALLDAFPRLEKLLKRTWDDPEHFLRDLGQRSGLIAEHDGPGTPWRYLHRALRDHLAAVALEQERQPEGATREPFDVLAAYAADEPRWGETVALLSGLLDREDPRRTKLLDALVSGDSDLALRTLPQLEGLECKEAFELLQRVEDDEGGPAWDGDDLRRLVLGLHLERRSDEDIAAAVLADVDASMDTQNLAHRFYALERNRIEFDQSAFFESAGRPAPGRVELPRLVHIEGGSFTMGSPESEADRNGNEVQHEVTVSSFGLAATQVTVGEYLRFDSGKEAENAQQPVVEVSWWEAWLYARWLGARLPTEAEWEYACRAGTAGPWSCAKSELDEHAWYRVNAKGKLQSVATRRPNPWDLHDMHGNVWEWCADWFGKYPTEPCVDPEGPEEGAVRVLRGGGYWDSAVRLRSALRYGYGPGGRWNLLGFRVALSPPRAD